MRPSSSAKPGTFLGKALSLLRRRPAHVLLTARGFCLFVRTSWLRRLFPPFGVQFGSDVRLQKLRCVMAEAPYGRIAIGAKSIVYEHARIEAYNGGCIEIGEESVIGDVRIVSRYRISIGKRFLSSWNVFIEDFEPHPLDPCLRARQVSDIVQSFRPRLGQSSSTHEHLTPAEWSFPGAEIRLGDDVWVGANVTILKGVRIGNGCTIATGSVVVGGEYPDRSIIAGNPARVVKAC